MPKLCECGCGGLAPIAKRTNATKGHRKGEPVRFIRGHSTAAMRERVAAAKRGRPRSEQTRAKIAAALKGRRDSPAVRAKKIAAAERGAASPVWVGSEASYNAVHNRARLSLPTECAEADNTCKGLLEVALRHGLPASLVRTSPRGHRYYIGPDVEAGYTRLCRSHHRRHDGNRPD